MRQRARRGREVLRRLREDRHARAAIGGRCRRSTAGAPRGAAGTGAGPLGAMSGSPPEGEPLCPRCGAPHGPNQEYCLECGRRLTPPRGVFGRLSTAWRNRFGWYPGDWVWRVLLGFVIAVAGASAAIVLSEAGAEDRTIVATTGGPPHAPTTAPQTATVALPSVPSGTPTG